MGGKFIENLVVMATMFLEINKSVTTFLSINIVPAAQPVAMPEGIRADSIRYAYLCINIIAYPTGKR